MYLNKILGLLLLLPSFVIAQQVKIPDGWSDAYAYVNGIRVHYYHAIPQQSKPVIVMVHGLSDLGLCWTPIALKLQDKYNIYMVDSRGHGLSDPFTAADNSETLIKDVVDFVKVYETSKSDTDGTFYGGSYSNANRSGIPGSWPCHCYARSVAEITQCTASGRSAQPQCASSTTNSPTRNTN